MDFVPLLIAILSQWIPFTIFSGNENSVALHVYGTSQAGSAVELQCLTAAGEYINAQYAYFGSENINSALPGFPLRKASFTSVFANLPPACTVKTENLLVYWPHVCLKLTHRSYKHSVTLRVVQNGEPVNMWSVEEELQFLLKASSNKNLRLAAVQSDASSPDFREFVSYGSSDTRQRMGGGQPGENGKPCWESIEQAHSSVGLLVFEYTGWMSEIDFFDPGNWEIHDNGVEFPLGGTPDVLIGIDNVSAWGPGNSYQDLFEALNIL